MHPKLLIAAALAALAATPALADDELRSLTPVPAEKWMSVATLTTKLEGQGYRVLEIEREDGRAWEVEMLDAKGMRVKAWLHPETGEVLPGIHDD